MNHLCVCECVSVCICECECVHCNIMERVLTLARAAKVGGRQNFRMKEMHIHRLRGSKLVESKRMKIQEKEDGVMMKRWDEEHRQEDEPWT